MIWTVGIGIMTVPSRLDQARELAAELTRALPLFNLVQSLPFLHVDDHMKGPWFGWRGAFELAASQAVSHVLVLQDDVALCLDFLPALYKLVELRPTDVLGLCNWRSTYVNAAVKAGVHMVRSRECYTQALCLPKYLGQQALRWIDAHEGTDPAWSVHDDYRLEAFLKARKYGVFYPVPTLADHQDGGVSTMKHAPRTRDGLRQSKLFVGKETSALRVAWSREYTRV